MAQLAQAQVESQVELENPAIVEMSDEELRAFQDEPLSPERLEAFAHELAVAAVSDSLTAAIHADPRSLREIAKVAGMDPGNLSRLANGKNCEVESLARVALALGKSLHISIA